MKMTIKRIEKLIKIKERHEKLGTKLPESFLNAAINLLSDKQKEKLINKQKIKTKE